MKSLITLAALGFVVGWAGVVVADAACQPNVATNDCQEKPSAGQAAEGGGTATFGGHAACRENNKVIVSWSETCPADPNHEPPLPPSFCTGMLEATLVTSGPGEGAARTYTYRLPTGTSGNNAMGTCSTKGAKGCVVKFTVIAQHLNPDGSTTQSNPKGPCTATHQ